MESEKPLLIIFNNHSPVCGEPPAADYADRGKYYGYYQNCDGEQWIFVYDFKIRRGTLRGGDGGWDKSYNVIGGRVADLLLNTDERQWLASCWNAAVGYEMAFKRTSHLNSKPDRF